MKTKTLTVDDPKIPIDVIFEIKYHTKNFKVKLNDEENFVECRDYRVEYNGNTILCRFDDDEVDMTHIMFDENYDPSEILILMKNEYNLYFVEDVNIGCSEVFGLDNLK